MQSSVGEPEPQENQHLKISRTGGFLLRPENLPKASNLKIYQNMPYMQAADFVARSQERIKLFV